MAFDTLLSLCGPLRRPHQMLADQEYGGHTSIHDDAMADVPDVGLQRGQLPVAQAESRHVDKHDAVVRRQPCQVAGECLGDQGVHLLAPSGLIQGGVVLGNGAAARQEGEGGAAHDRQEVLR